MDSFYLLRKGVVFLNVIDEKYQIICEIKTCCEKLDYEKTPCIFFYNFFILEQITPNRGPKTSQLHVITTI